MKLPAKKTATRLSIAALAVGFGLAQTGVTTARAATVYNVIDRTAADVTADALPTTQIDGIAWDQVIVGNTVYVGGEFANARPAGVAPGASQTPRSNLLAYDLTTGVLKTGFAPVVNGKVRSLAVSPDRTRLYIAGNFTTVNGQPRQRLAAFNLADGSLDTSFHPQVNGEVNAVVASNDTVWFGGLFSAVDGWARSRLAAASRSGALNGWAPTADLHVNTMALTPDGSQLAVGGSFSTLNGVFSPGMGFVDAATGTVHPFAANQVVQNHGDTSGIYSLKNDGKNILATGWWYAGVGNFEGTLSATPDTGEIRWMADCHGDSYDATTIGPTTYMVGHPHYCANMGSFEEQVPRVFRRALAFTDRATTTTRHDSQGYHDFYGQPAPTEVNWAPDLSAANVSGSWQAAWTAESTDKYLVLGGEFPRVNGIGQQGLVRFALPGIAPGKSGPKFTWDWTPTATVVGTSTKIAWPSNVDRDNMSLTYRLYRSDRPGAPLWSGEGESQWYNRPVMGFLDDGLVAGTTYSYWVTAIDADGNTATSQRVKVTAGATSIPATEYSRAVQADGANHYWRLLEAPGSRTSIDWRGGNDLRLDVGVLLDQPGSVGDGSVDAAAHFNGQDDGRAVMSNAEDAPEVFSTELWFMSTSTAGGKLIGFGNAASGDSTSYDRHLYLDGDGRVHFGVYPGAAKVVSSGSGLNDGNYHHVVATLSDRGQELWVDGRLVAADSTTTSAQADLHGYWKVGGDQLSGWPGATRNNVEATIDEVAVYPTALTRDQIRAHYVASGRKLVLPAQPTDAYGKVVMADDPALLWRLDETRTPVVVDASENLTNGTWFGTPGLRTASPVTGTNGTGVTLGADGVHVASDLRQDSPQVFSVESWFSTTSTTGGKIIGFGNSRDGSSQLYDRHVWLDERGHLNFGVWNAGHKVITSEQSFNDGKWHHVVGTMGPNGMALFVDGVQVGSHPNTFAENFIGHWRLGGDSSWSGDSWFDGQLDEAAVYNRVLSASQVRNHYRASAAATNKAPEPRFTVSCDGATCTFDASGSTDPDGIIGSYTWNFGDGTKATGEKVTRTYAASGSYQVELTVADDQQLKASTSQTVQATVGNKAPVASIAVDCTGLACRFDSAGSTDAEGPIASQSWDLGDGTSSTEVAPEHVYATAGTYPVRLTVVDAAGASHSVTRELVVSATNALPAASFTSTVTDLEVAFDASASKDADGTITSYEWDFGDGTKASGVTARHAYPSAGTRTVTLTVTDDKGGRSVRTSEITVAEKSNTPPVADFEAVVTGNDVALDATASADADGSIASYEWDFGDGTTGTGTTATHFYKTASTYTITLTVTDDAGARHSTTRAVTIAARANQAPTAAFTHTEEGLTSQFDASASKDADGTIASYEWDFGDGTKGTGRTVGHDYAEAGDHEVTLTVTDDAGATATSTSTVTVQSPQQTTVIGRDGFGAVESRWGSADQGGSYEYVMGAANFSTSGSAGLVTASAGSTSRVLLPGASATDVTVQADLSVDRLTTGSGLYSSLMARNSSAGYYSMGVRWMPDGTLHLVAYRNAGGATTTLREVAVPGVRYEPGTVLRASLHAAGERIEGTVWAAEAPKPATPQLVVTDGTPALQTSGAAGLNVFLSGSATNGPVTLAVDNLIITKD